jgi:hypothetical protein
MVPISQANLHPRRQSVGSAAQVPRVGGKNPSQFSCLESGKIMSITWDVVTQALGEGCYYCNCYSLK